MNKFLTSIGKLLGDERGEVGTDPTDDPSDDSIEGDQEPEDEELDVDDELFINLDEKEDEEDAEAKAKAAEDKAKTSEEETKNLRSEVETLKEKEKEWKRDMYNARKDREAKGLDTDKDEKPLTDAQLSKLLEDASEEKDTAVQLNVLKYLAQRVSKGEVKEAVSAAEMTRKADDFTKQLETKFPTIKDSTSDMRTDLDQVKSQLGIEDHPYGDMFAVGFKLFQDMDRLLEASYEAGQEDKLKGTADEKRKKEIKEKALPTSKRSPYKKTYGLNASQLETAVQMNLTQDQLPAYTKLVGKKPRTVSVEG